MEEIWKKVHEMSQKALGGGYIYRGESKSNKLVSSRLYRDYQNDWKEDWNIERIQENYLREARRFTDESDELSILTELQHYGGSTNLIDFTTDFLIALYFACDGDPEDDGRVIFLKRDSRLRTHFFTPSKLAHRVTAQKSIFVRPPKGIIEKEDFEPLTVSRHQKEGILEYLTIAHGISLDYVYNDLHGFIRYKAIHQKASDNFFQGLAYYNSEDYPDAIKSCTESIRLNPRQDFAYNNRGAAYIRTCDFDSAKRDFDKALEINPSNRHALFNRGVIRLIGSCWDKARSDLCDSKMLGLDITQLFLNDYSSIDEFAQMHNIELPQEIIALLLQGR